ncbi:hypothetical protein O181_105024 [Austropuccinia psidii MF-1]|uniref:CCHC-type domain-containing protein n=1 Tax=Austropuccinia psidii MF-1 TaxID=1389203 RepID=A0A9Q3PKQ4_9BASI|nr:hypothetical protein [Austropuccinia psidii MF-1]
MTKFKTFEYIQQKLGNEILQVKETQKTIVGLENVNKYNILSLTQICARIESKVTLLNQPDDNSISFITRKLKELRIQVQNLENSTGNKAALFPEQLEKSDKERLELKEDIQSSINNISLKNELPRHFKDIPKLEEWPNFSGEGEYNHMEFMKTIDIFQEDFNIPDEYISARLHSFFTKSAKKWYHKIRQDHGKHSWPWWKEQIICKWENNSWRFKMENSFEEAIFNIEKDRPMSWFLKKKDRLTGIHPDESETMVHKRILRKCGDNKNSGKPISKPKKPQDRLPLKCHKCGSTSHLANTCPKKTRINEIEIEKDDTKETNDVHVHESDSEPSEEEELPDELGIENINVSFEVMEVHTQLPQYSDEYMDLIHIQDAKIQKPKPAREAKIHLDSGAFCTCVGKGYLEKTYTNWKDKIMPIEGIKFSSASQNMHPLGIFEEAMRFPHPVGSIRLKVEFVVMNNFTSKHFILGNDYLNIYGIDINNQKDMYFTIGENKRQKFAFPLEKREITVIKQVKNVNKEKFVSNQLIEAQISPELTLEMLEKGCNPKLPVDTLRKDLVNIHPTASRFMLLLDKVRHHANQSMNYAFEYAKQKLDKSHKTPEFKVGDLILVSTLNFNNIKGPKKLKDSFSGPFIIKALHGTNAVQVELSGELENKHPTFPVSLVKHYTSSDKELFPLRNETPLEVPPLDQSEEKKVLKVLIVRRLRGKNDREYLVRYKNLQHEDEWIVESKIPDSQKFLRRFRHERRPIAQ